MDPVESTEAGQSDVRFTTLLSSLPKRISNIIEGSAVVTPPRFCNILKVK